MDAENKPFTSWSHSSSNPEWQGRQVNFLGGSVPLNTFYQLPSTSWMFLVLVYQRIYINYITISPVYIPSISHQYPQLLVINIPSISPLIIIDHHELSLLTTTGHI